MIKSVLFRHGADDPAAKRHVESRLAGLEMRDRTDISRIKVVLDRASASGRSANYLCHISLRGQGKAGVEIYADKNHPKMAIDDAFDRLYFALNSRAMKRFRKTRRT